MVDSLTDKIKKVFVWLFTLVSFVVLMFGAIQSSVLFYKTVVFPGVYGWTCPEPITPNGEVSREKANEVKNYYNCQEEQDKQKKRDLADALGLLSIGLPSFIFFYKQGKKIG